jgi:hypothetical protein
MNIARLKIYEMISILNMTKIAEQNDKQLIFNIQLSLYLQLVSYYEIMFHNNFFLYYDLADAVKRKFSSTNIIKSVFLGFHIDLIKNHDVDFVY